MHNSIQLNGHTFRLKECQQKLEEKLPEWERYIFTFLVDWFSNSSSIQVQTSGSTGTPKLISKPKSTLRNSASMTGKFFDFSTHQSALLCLPSKYIAGKMMLVRAIEWQLNLDYIEPKTVLNIPQKTYYFSAITPSQAEVNLTSLTNIENLIIGGAPISNTLENRLKNLKPNSYATYGMTETVSHIALRKIGHTSYFVLEGISISADPRSCLQISAPQLIAEPIITNDIVEITSINSFIWNGRIDNVINSGGVKISPELIENEISSLIKNPFIITGKKDEKWGEIVVLLIEGKPFQTSSLKSSMEKILPKIQLPKSIYFMEEFTYTENGKIKRTDTLKLLKI